MALELAPEYRDTMMKLIDKYPVSFSHIEADKVLVLKETEKSPKKYADIRTVRYPYNFMTEYKFVIIFYEPVMAPMTEAQKNMVVFHEMLHIDPDFTRLRKHNIQDFAELLSIYGINWSIDPNLPNILDDDNTAPSIVIKSNNDDEDDDEPEIM